MPVAAQEMFDSLYGELQRIATACLRRERPGHTLIPAAIVHEAYLRLRGMATLAECGKTRFLAVAASSIREVLVDHARHRQALKRGGGWDRVSISEATGEQAPLAFEVLALEQALTKLAIDYPRAAKIVELRFFGGLEEREIAIELSLSRTTIQAEWRFARAWLHRELAP